MDAGAGQSGSRWVGLDWAGGVASSPGGSVLHYRIGRLVHTAVDWWGCLGIVRLFVLSLDGTGGGLLVVHGSTVRNGRTMVDRSIAANWRGHQRLDLPGAQGRREHFAGRAIHDAPLRDWMERFIDLWLASDAR